MRVFLTGGTGMVGSAVLAELARAGHEVTAAVRSESAAASVSALGAAPVFVSLTDVAALTSLVGTHDVAIFAAAPSEAPEVANEAFVTAALAADRPAVLTGGSWVHGAGEITDDSPLAPPELVVWRVASEERLLTGSSRATVVEPGIVFGGRAGLYEALVDGPVDAQGRRVLIGDGRQRWSWVHVDELAELYRLIVESGRGFGRVLAAVSGPPVAELVQAAHGDAVVAASVAATRERFGAAFGNALLLDQQVWAAKAESLGWRATRHFDR